MRTETLWLRAAYPAWARMPRGRMGWRAVSEAVRVEVPVVEGEDVPVALRVVRPMTGRASTDADAWLGVARDRGEAQRFEVRTGPDGLLAPVLEPDGQTVLTASRLPALTERVARGREHARYKVRRCAAWEDYPGARPTNAHDPDISNGTWPDVTSVTVNRPVWDCPDLGSAGFAAIDEGLRAEALAAFRAKVAGLRIVDGELWRPCGTPVVMVDLVGATLVKKLVVPGLDPDPLGPVRPLDVFAAVDFRSPLPDEAHFAVESVLDVPRADVVRTNLVALATYAARHLRDTSYGNLPYEAMPLLTWLKGLQARVDQVADLDAVEADTCRVIRDTGDVLRPPAGSLSPFVRIGDPLARWVDLVGAERALALEDAEPDPDVLTAIM